ncbi:phage tail assembly chaperone [Paraburkholderia youngii]|uniref:XkdW family protein n=1 Tax=Paraburkholderia youngii TaxID=2782701 RepID=UPI003D227C5B
MDFDLQGYTHDLMVLAVQDMFPALVPGRDFQCAHMIDEATGLQKGDPFIIGWRDSSIPRPTDASVHDHFRANDARLRAAYIRSLRNEALANTDARATMPEDAPASFTKENIDAWRTYRQALRDMPQQPGFPFGVVWPARPK